MRSKQIVESVAIGAFVLVAATCQADSELSPYLSFTVPGLDGAIERIELADIDGDNFAEVLACDGHTVVLFSLPNNMLFTDTLDSDYPEYEIELADVNRDSVADIVIGLYYKHDWDYVIENKLVLYDSASVDRRRPDQVITNPLYKRCNEIEQSTVEAIDINGDGYNELLFSFEASEMWYAWTSCRTIGHTDVYYSYPDSLLSNLDVHLHGQWPLPVTIDNAALLTQRLKSDYVIWAGPNSSVTYQVVAMLMADGTAADLFWWPFPSVSWTCGTEGPEIYSAFSLGCVVGSSIPFIVIGNYSYSARCYPTEDLRGNGLAAASVYSTDSTELLWDNPMDGDFSNFIAHPTFPNQFFAMAGDTLMRFDATDGSLLKQYDPLPEGMKFWEYPYSDGEPFLVVVNFDTVTYYHFDVATDVAGEPDNSALPSTFTLGQPYPNPFNPTVTLPITVSRKGQLKVEVYNPLGQKVATIHDATTTAGEFDLTWDATGFASGMYLLRATLGNESKTVKAVLLK